MPRKLSRSMMRTWALNQLKQQGGLCPLCGLPIDATVKGEVVVDHDHDTGLIRGVLHRSCNSAEGKVANAAGRWGAKSMKYANIIPWLDRLLTYLKQPPHDLVYPTHKTEDELKAKQLEKRRIARKAVSAAQRNKKEGK